MHRLSILMLCGLLAMQVSPGLSNETQTRAVPTLVELKEILNRQWGRITSMDVSISIGGREFVDGATLFRLIESKGVARGNERFAFKGQNRFLERTRTNLSKTFRQVGPADPALISRLVKEPDVFERVARGEIPGFEAVSKTNVASTKAAFTGAELRQIQGEMIFVYSGEQAVKLYQFEPLYVRSLGYFIIDPTSSPDSNRFNTSFSLPGNLDQFEYSLSRDTIEEGNLLKAEGMTCVTCAENLRRKDVIWLDPLRGYMMVRRDTIDPASGQVEYRVTNSDPKEVLPGLWLPMKSTRDEFAPSTAPKEFRGTRLTQTELTVTNIVLNDVPDELFELPVPPGYVVADFTSAGNVSPYDAKPVIYQQPVSAKMFDAAAAAGSAHLRTSTLWLIAVNLMVLALAGAFFVYAKMRS